MVTTFNAKDMTAFGNYLLDLVSRGIKQPEPSGEIKVTHADFCNWKDSLDKVKKVRAKFECQQILPDENGEVTHINMFACIEGSPENKEFSKYTPGGQFNLMIDNDAYALELFEEGREYYLDIIKAPVED